MWHEEHDERAIVGKGRMGGKAEERPLLQMLRGVTEAYRATLYGSYNKPDLAT